MSNVLHLNDGRKLTIQQGANAVWDDEFIRITGADGQIRIYPNNGLINPAKSIESRSQTGGTKSAWLDAQNNSSRPERQDIRIETGSSLWRDATNFTGEVFDHVVPRVDWGRIHPSLGAKPGQVAYQNILPFNAPPRMKGYTFPGDYDEWRREFDAGGGRAGRALGELKYGPIDDGGESGTPHGRLMSPLAAYGAMKLGGKFNAANNAKEAKTAADYARLFSQYKDTQVVEGLLGGKSARLSPDMTSFAQDRAEKIGPYTLKAGNTGGIEFRRGQKPELKIPHRYAADQGRRLQVNPGPPLIPRAQEVLDRFNKFSPDNLSLDADGMVKMPEEPKPPKSKFRGVQRALGGIDDVVTPTASRLGTGMRLGSKALKGLPVLGAELVGDAFYKKFSTPKNFMQADYNYDQVMDTYLTPARLEKMQAGEEAFSEAQKAHMREAIDLRNKEEAKLGAGYLNLLPIIGGKPWHPDSQFANGGWWSNYVERPLGAPLGIFSGFEEDARERNLAERLKSMRE